MFQENEITGYAAAADFFFNLTSCKSGQKSQSGVFDSQTVKNSRHVHALASGKQLLRGCAVGLSKCKLVDSYDVVQRRIKSNGINHVSNLLLYLLALLYNHKQS